MFNHWDANIISRNDFYCCKDIRLLYIDSINSKKNIKTLYNYKAYYYCCHAITHFW
jgi:hypothetical protein